MGKQRIIGAVTCGSYPTWAAWTVASMYNFCDKIVVVNGGFDFDHPELGDSIPLEREMKQIKSLDRDGKVTQIRPSWDKVRFAKKGRDETGRSRNMELSFYYAYLLGRQEGWSEADIWIMKQDSDQVLQHDVTGNKLLKKVFDKNTKGIRLSMYSEFHREWDKCMDLPHEFTNDGPLFFNNPNAWATGQGSPQVGDQIPVYDLFSFHLRRIHPPDVDEYEYHYKRFLYHLYGPNEIGELQEAKEMGRPLTLDELKDMAKKKTDSFLSTTGHTVDYFNNDERFPPGKPKVVELGYLDYIKSGFPKEN